MKQSEKGAVTVMFIFFSMALVGAISYSLYVGQKVERKIELQSASDSAVFSVTSHASQGLNMISANNLAIGASLHVSAAVPVLATYASLVYAFTYDLGDIFNDVVAGFGLATNAMQDAVWNTLGPLVGIMFQSASGVTGFNDFIHSFWMKTAGIPGIEVGRSYLPGGLFIPIQAAGTRFLMAYDGLERTRPEEAMCTTIDASKDIEGRDQVMNWIAGPVATFKDTQSIYQSVNSIMNFINKYVPIKLAFVGCGFGLKIPFINFIERIATGVAYLLDSGNVIANIALAIGMREKIDGDFQSFHLAIRGDLSGVPLAQKPFCNKPLIKTASSTQVAYHLANDRKRIVRQHSLYKSLQKIKSSVGNSLEDMPKMIDYTMKCEQGPSVGTLRRYRYPISKNPIFPQYRTFQTLVQCQEFAQSEYQAAVAKMSNLTCKLPDGRVKYGYIPHPDSVEKHTCLNVRNLDPHCALRAFSYNFGAMACPGKVKDRVDQFHKICGAQGFKESGETKTHAPGFEYQFVDFGKQIKTYAADDARRQIGFLVIEDTEAFTRSLEFFVIGAESIGTPRQSETPCPESLMIKEPLSGESRCDFSMLKGLSPLRDLDASVSAKMTREFNLASGGLDEATREGVGRLGTSLGRSIWVKSTARVRRADGPQGSNHASLFWPNWYGVMAPIASSPLINGLSWVLGGDEQEAAGFLATH